MKTLKNKSWTIKFETMQGEVKMARYYAPTVSLAIDILISDRDNVANILEVRDSKRVVWL